MAIFPNSFCNEKADGSPTTATPLPFITFEKYFETCQEPGFKAKRQITNGTATVNWEIFNGNKFSRLAESTKN